MVRIFLNGENLRQRELWSVAGASGSLLLTLKAAFNSARPSRLLAPTYSRPALSWGSRASSKHAMSPYRSGSSKTWLKTKCFTKSTFVVVGMDRDRRTGAQRALPAHKDSNGLSYAGAAFIALDKASRGIKHLLDFLHHVANERCEVVPSSACRRGEALGWKQTTPPCNSEKIGGMSAAVTRSSPPLAPSG